MFNDEYWRVERKKKHKTISILVVLKCSSGAAKNEGVQGRFRKPTARKEQILNNNANNDVDAGNEMKYAIIAQPELTSLLFPIKEIESICPSEGDPDGASLVKFWFDSTPYED